jgi:hypothetical protein
MLRIFGKTQNESNIAVRDDEHPLDEITEDLENEKKTSMV